MMMAPEEYLEILFQEMMKKGRSNWGRIAVTATLAQKLWTEAGNNQNIVKTLAKLIAMNIPEGGWEVFNKDYGRILKNGEEAKTKETWKYIAAALSMVGIYATVTLAFHYGSS